MDSRFWNLPIKSHWRDVGRGRKAARRHLKMKQHFYIHLHLESNAENFKRGEAVEPPL